MNTLAALLVLSLSMPAPAQEDVQVSPAPAQEAPAAAPAEKAAPAQAAPAESAPAAQAQEGPTKEQIEKAIEKAPGEKPTPPTGSEGGIPEVHPEVEGSTAPAQAPAPAAKEPVYSKDVVSCATYTRDVTIAYEKLAEESKDFTKRSHEKLLPFIRDEEEIKAKIASLEKEINEKTLASQMKGAVDPKSIKKEIKVLEKEVKVQNKALKAAGKERKRQCASVQEQFEAMGQRHSEFMKMKFKECSALLEAAE